MSFLQNNNSAFLSARITQNGRKAIANGNFKISYFQIGDSEFDYNLIFSGLTGKTNHEMVMAPFDKESGVKYPYKLDSSDTSTTYGVPVNNYLAPTPIRNAMGSAGFVTNYIPFNPIGNTGTGIKTYHEDIPYSSINGGSTYTVLSGSTFKVNDFVTIVFNEFSGTDPDNAVISGNSTSYVYKIINITGNTLTFDRNMPNISSLTGTGEIVLNNGELEYPNTSLTTCPPIPIDVSDQHNPWTMDVVWGDTKPIGVNISGSDNTVSGYTSNKHMSTKELLGYTTISGQTFNDITGGTITSPTSYLNSFGEVINVNSEEQRTIAVLHYSELGDLVNDPERFYKYDDYISSLTTDPIISENSSELTDTEYFEIYIPFIYYHRNSGATAGAMFLMDTTDFYLNSTVNDRHQLLFRYLLDESGNKVGKVFPKNKIVVFDDQELVAILDIRTNRRYTLDAPKVGLIHTDDTPYNSLLDGTTGKTMWVTYMLSNSTGVTALNGLPCNYYSKVISTSTPSNVTVKFENAFNFMNTSFSGATNGYISKRFYILAQETNTGDLPLSNSWVLMDYTVNVGGNGSTYLDPNNINNTTFTITKNAYNNGVMFFDLETFMGVNYTSVSGVTQFGEEQKFPGSVRLVRASDIETLNFLVNLPSTQFITTQNPTYISGDKRITEMALLNDNKEVLVIGKTTFPIKRNGTQVFSLKLDF